MMANPCFLRKVALCFALLAAMGFLQLDRSRIEQEILGLALGSRDTRIENQVVLREDIKSETSALVNSRKEMEEKDTPAAPVPAVSDVPETNEKKESPTAAIASASSSKEAPQQPETQQRITLKRAPDFDGHGEWPWVVEKYKIIFFHTSKVGKTAWRMVARHMMGFGDQDHVECRRCPQFLKYIKDYNETEQERMIKDPTWTKAFFVREPKERLLSAYLNKAVDTSLVRHHCCHGVMETCVKPAEESFQGFFEVVTTQCPFDIHWRPQYQNIKAEWWPHINFVGHMETISQDAERLLKRVGAWEEHGKTGWGTYKNESVFAPKPDAAGRQHATNAKEKLRLHYTPELERIVESYYEGDYGNPKLNLSLGQIFSKDN